jgi:hypothetical protein
VKYSFYVFPLIDRFAYQHILQRPSKARSLSKQATFLFEMTIEKTALFGLVEQQAYRELNLSRSHLNGETQAAKQKL